MNQVAANIKPKDNDPLQGIGGPMTRSRAKKMQESLCGIVEEIQKKEVIQHESKMLIMLSVEEDVLEGNMAEIT